MTRVVAPSRLHFGLLSLTRFGGVGLMVDQPGLSLRVEPADAWSAKGPLADRALAFANRFDDRRPFSITVERSAAEHSGLGVGTQLGLSVAKALAMETGLDLPTPTLAARVGRGERSAVGVIGFERGGLIVEGGKPPGGGVSPMVAHFDWPEEWAVLLFTPNESPRWSGDAERDAFARLEAREADTDRLCRLVLTGILPGIATRDLDAFGESLYEFNARAGDLFAMAQGGRYVSPAVADCVSRLRSLGVKGVGQSSWGPTVFAVVRNEDAADLMQKMGGGGVARGSRGHTVYREPEASAK